MWNWIDAKLLTTILHPALWKTYVERLNAEELGSFVFGNFSIIQIVNLL
jgi:hypothetical protein